MPDAATHDPRPHAIIIGSGFGGLAGAVRLGARGWRVTILEKLDAPGGRAYTYRQDGFTFDAGPTIITAPSRSIPRSAAISKTKSCAPPSASTRC